MKKLISMALGVWIWLVVCAFSVGTAHAEVTPAPVVPLPAISTCSPVGFWYDYLPVGRHIAILCVNATHSGVYVNGFSCLHAACSPSTLGMSVAQIILAPSPIKEIDTQWDANIKWTCDSPPDQAAKDLCAERRKWVSDNWSKWTAGFAPAVWRVKVNGAYTTRPAYPLVNGVLGPKASLIKATVGVLCDVSKPTHPATLGDIRAEFGTAGIVTICSKEK